ncbi:MAG: DNA cytosine methyltransferase [Holophagaceae bacterium]|nr:DNA cytosine methyltransferase [Holophagaceae bacterium]
MSFTAIDLFAGIGGFRTAIERCGGSCIAFSEIDSDAINAYGENHPVSVGTNLGDITAIGHMPPAEDQV